MCLERLKLQEENFKESPIFEEYRKLAIYIYRKLIERVTTDQNRYQETIQAMFEKVRVTNGRTYETSDPGCNVFENPKGIYTDPGE